MPQLYACPILIIAAAFVCSTVNAQDEAKAKPSRPIYLINADGTELRELLKDETDFDQQGTPVWSPDGKHIGFDAWRSKIDDSYSKTHVFITDAKGESMVDLGDGAMPSFSPDGKRVCYSRYGDNRGVWIANIDGTEKVLINARGWSARWSPDGKWIAYTVSGNIMLFDPEKSEEERLLLEEDDRIYRTIYWSFDWSADSKQIAFKGRVRETPESGDNLTYQIAIVSVDGSKNGFMVACEGEFGNQICWHPKGNRIIFAMHDAEQKKKSLFTANPNMPTDPERFDPQPDFKRFDGAAWSPDGKTLLLAGER